MNFLKPSSLFFYLILSVIFFPSAGLTKSFISEEKNLIKKEERTDKYRLSARIISSQPLFRLEKSSPLTWSKDAQSSSSSWTATDNSYNWKPDDRGASINIPLKNNFTREDKIPISLDEVHIEYQDLFPGNPSQFSLEMAVLEKQTPDSTNVIPTWKKKVVTAISELLLKPKIKEDLYSSPLKKKDTIYLAKRELDLPFDPTWRYIQDKVIAKTYGDHTVFQRRFHMDLRFIETIDIVFHDESTEEELENFRCNFRITHTETAKKIKLVEHYKLAHGYKYIEGKNQILNINGKKTIRFNIGDFVRNAYKTNKVVFLKEMIIFLPGLADEVMFKRPIQSINFYKNNQITQPIPEISWDISSTRWIKKNINYLLKHEIGFPTPPSWRYYQDKKFSVFERTLHKDLHEIKSMDFILNKDITKPEKMFCRLRVGFSDRPYPSKVINCDTLSKEIIKTNDQHLLRIQLHDLVRQFYAQGKKRVFLEELTFYLAGPTNYYIENQLLKTVRFFKLGKPEVRKICFNSSKLCSRTEFLSQTHKRYMVDMAMMNELIGENSKLIGLTLKVKPKKEKSPSGFKLKKARATLRTKNNQQLLSDGKNLVKRWGGPFLDLTKRKGLIEKIQVNAFYSFQNMDENAPYETGKSFNSDITAFSSKNAMHRLRKNSAGINCDFIFFSKDATLFLELPSVGPFLEDRLVEFHIKTDGPFNLVPLNPLTSWSQSADKISFQLKKGTTPKFKINASFDFNSTVLKENLLLNLKQASTKSIPSFEVRGLVNLKKIEIHGLSPASQGLTVSFSKPNSSSSKKQTKAIQSGGIKISTQNSFDRWNLINSGLILEGTGKWVEIDWKLDSSLHKNSRFFLKTSKNTDSVLSTEIIPISGGQSLKPIPAFLNQPIQLGNLTQENIDSLKVRLKLHDRPFRLVLKEIALFEPISASTDQTIDLSSFFHASFPLTPSKVKNILPSEVSIKKGQLKATLLTNRETFPALEWSTEINQKFSQIKWVKIKYLVSPSIHANNPCWLKLFFLGSNHKFEKTICTKNYDGDIRIPVTNNFTNNALKSIHWTVQVDKQKNPLPLLVTLDLAMSIYGLRIDTIRNNVARTLLVEMEGKDILPTFLKDLSANKIAHLRSWWDLGVISTNPKFDFEKNIRSSPSFSVHNLFLERIIPANTLNKNTIEGQDPPNPISPSIQIGIWWRLLIFFTAIVILGWVSNTNKVKKLSRQFFSNVLAVFRFSKIEKYPHIYLLLAAILYFLALLTALRPYQNYIYSMGSIIFSLASYNFAKLNYHRLANFFPWSLEKFFTQKENLLTSLFLFFLSIAALFKMVALDRVAEQVTIIGFIMLFTVIFFRMFKPFEENDDL